MLSAIGSADQLFADIPPEIRAKPLNLPPGLTEQEARARLARLSERNAPRLVSFLGGGFYDHYVPAAVDALISRSEFYTAYTPYQPEASQGTLQAIYRIPVGDLPPDGDGGVQCLALRRRHGHLRGDHDGPANDGAKPRDPGPERQPDLPQDGRQLHQQPGDRACGTADAPRQGRPAADRGRARARPPRPWWSRTPISSAASTTRRTSRSWRTRRARCWSCPATRSLWA